MLRRMADMMIDAQFMKSPLPVLRAARALRRMVAGETLRLLATDPTALAELREFCKANGHALVATSEVKGVFSFTIRRKAEVVA